MIQQIDKQTGFSLVEMLVAMSLLMAILVVFVQTIQTTQRSYLLLSLQAEQREQLRIIRDNINRELRRAIYFFLPGTALPAGVTQDAVPQMILAGKDVPGNAVCFVGMEQTNLSTLPGNPGAAANARVQLFAVNCLYLRTMSPNVSSYYYDAANPKALQLVLYQDRGYYNNDPATVLWPKGQQPGQTQAWIVHLTNDGYTGWVLPSQGTAVPFPASTAFARRRVLGSFIGTNPTKQTALLPSEYGLEFQFDNNNAVSENITLSRYDFRLKTLSTSSILGKVLPRNLRIE